MKTECAEELRKLYDGTSEAVKALESLQRPVQKWDDWLVFTTVQKLDSTTRKDWENSLTSTTKLPTFDELCAFLQHRINTLELVSVTTARSKDYVKYPQHNKPASIKVHIAANKCVSKVRTCPQCRGKHLLLFCPSFRQKTILQRRDFVSKEQLCFNCLRTNHVVANCPSTNRCKHCNQPHHSMLHPSGTDSTPTASSSSHSMGTAPSSTPFTDNNNTSSSLTKRETMSSRPSNVTALSTQASLTRKPRSILLATARVTLRSPSGKQMQVRALLDQGSQATFVSSVIASYLQLPSMKVKIPIKGIGSSSELVKAIVHLTIQSLVRPDFLLEAEALVLPKLTKVSVPQKAPLMDLPHLHDLQLADPAFADNTPIDVIIGADLYHLIIQEGIRKGNPTAQNTSLGWVLSGPINSDQDFSEPQPVAYHITATDPEPLNLLLPKFWEVEEIPQHRVILTDEDTACEEFYKKSTRRDPNGRYIVRLPIRPVYQNAVIFGDSKSNAVRSLKFMEHRFTVNSDLKGHYIDFMEEYQKLNHMEEIQTDQGTIKTDSLFYLPHHGVLNENSVSTKLRVVFNGSRKSKGGLSLNDYMSVGPKLQLDLFSVVMRWRQHSIVFSADIKMMYRQIQVDRRDCDLQRIVWRKTPSEPIKSYRLLTVTYGTTAAPYLAIRTLLQLADDEESKYPLAATIIRRNFYVDDVLFGADDVSSAINAQNQLVGILEAGGFKLHKWSSNSDEALKSLNFQYSYTDLNLIKDSVIRTLGLLWNPSTDCFKFQVKLFDLPSVLTKRKLLSDIAKLYDPLGFLSPTVLIAKSMIQKLWLQNLDWDTPLPDSIAQNWSTFRRDLLHLENISIPRWIGIHPSSQFYQIHTFSDASELAYSAVIYFRTIPEFDNIQTSLLCAKTKLAPLKKMSIPRLELMGAHLLARLLNNLLASLDVEGIPIYCWTDSLTVLTWLTAHPSKWKTFVANRVSQIQEMLPMAKWRHVPTSCNPADCASRGVSAATLQSHSLWWEGPSWLKCASAFWPIAPSRSSPASDVDLEEKSTVICSTVSLPTEKSWDLLFQYSSLTRLQRVTAWCYRYLNNSRTSLDHRTKGSLSPKELTRALLFWIQKDQRVSFPQEYHQLSTGLSISNRSPLLRLSPFFNNQTLTLHVGGRLQHSSLYDDCKHQILLAKNSPLSSLIINDTHLKTMHGGVQLTLSVIRQKYWILGARDLVRRQLRRCVTCYRQRASSHDQLMGILPPERVRPSRPFLHTGLDYAGPILVRYGPGRGRPSHKSYIALFVCMATKAIHLELVSDLTSDAFIAAYKRFTARRGYCAKVYSDNATTFVGASKELQNAFFLCQSQLPEQLDHLLASQGTEWHFIPPKAPNFGGLWEAGVKAVKHHIKRVLGTSTLTFEELYTLLTQVEACVNSRPLYPLSPDANDLEVLTPGHFLMGAAPLTTPEPTLKSINPNRLSRWKLLHQMYEHFWRRWSSEYLSNLQERTKWMKKQQNIRPGLLVLIRDDQLPPATWALGRVIKVHPGTDGLVRVVTLRTNGHQLVRPINKICALPISDNDDPESNQSPSRRADTIEDVECTTTQVNPSRCPSWRADEPINLATVLSCRPIDEAGGDVLD